MLQISPGADREMLVPSGHFWHCLCGILVLLSSTQAASNIRTNGIQLVDDVGRVSVVWHLICTVPVQALGTG